MAKKIKHYSHVHVIKTLQKNGLLQIQLFEDYWKENVVLAKFYVPVQKTDPFMVSQEVLRYRAKHDAGITFDHYSCTMRSEQ